MSRLYQAFRYWRNCGASPTEAIDAARCEPVEPEKHWFIRGVLVEFNPWLRLYVVHLPKVERYFQSREAAFRQARDRRIFNRQRRRQLAWGSV